MLSLKFSPLEAYMKQAVDLAVHRAVTDSPAENKSELHRVAFIAASNAVEQYMVFINNELRLIEAEWERRAALSYLTPSRIGD